MRAFQFSALCSVRGRSDVVGRQVVPVATSRTTGCCNLATKAGICGSDSLPTPDPMSRSRWPGIEALISSKSAQMPPVHRVAQWMQIKLEIIAICSDILSDSHVGPDHRPTCQSAPRLYATHYLRVRHSQIGHALRSSTPANSPRRRTKESVCSALRLHPRLSLLLLLPALGTRNHIPE
jgi:hypothetical protein